MEVVKNAASLKEGAVGYQVKDPERFGVDKDKHRRKTLL